MLIDFKVQNFRSFMSQQEFSLVSSNYEKNLPQNVIVHSLPGLSGVKFLSSTALYGANASGKTNLLLALGALQGFVVKSFQADLTNRTCAIPFKLRQCCLSEPSKFEIQFVSQNIRYRYKLSLTSQQVVDETLVSYMGGPPQTWFCRRWNPQMQQYNWRFPNVQVRKGLRAISGRTRPNVAFLSKAADDGHPYLQQVCEWFARDLQLLNLAENPLSPLFSIEQLKNQCKRNQILALLQAADFDIVDMDVEEEILSVEDILSAEDIKKRLPPSLLKGFTPSYREGIDIPFKSVSVAFSHKGEKYPVKMDFDDESNGTQRYFSLLGPWLDILENGRVVLIDELETCLHPLLVIEIIKLFSSNLNKKGAQLIFTTHNPLFLDETLLRRDQVWFTQKDHVGATHLYPLTDYAPRKGEALVKGYLNGRYGSIPFIPNGLIPNE